VKHQTRKLEYEHNTLTKRLEPGYLVAWGHLLEELQYPTILVQLAVEAQSMSRLSFFKCSHSAFSANFRF